MSPERAGRFPLTAACNGNFFPTESTMINNVTKLHVEPKTVRETYRRQSITVKFLPETMTWQWEIEFTARLQFDGEE